MLDGEAQQERAGLVSISGMRLRVVAVMTHSLAIGDRVRARTSRFVPAGTLGRITMILVSVADTYLVRFDGRDRQILMRGVNLEIVTDAPGNVDTN